MTQASPTHTKCVYLIDGMAFVYRAHYSFGSRPLVNSRGMVTSAAYGFTDAMLRLLKNHDCRYMAVVFDVLGPGATFRSEMYGDYKANREPPPEDLVSNIPLIKAILGALGIAMFEEPNVEADDVIGSVARWAEQEDADVVIVSPDKDFQQLLSRRVSILKPAYRGEALNPVTEQTFRGKYGVAPERFVDILALAGDASDNVPGVPGIGKITAGSLIREYGTLESVLASKDAIRGKRAREGLQLHADRAVLSRELVTIRTTVEIELGWELLERARADWNTLRAIFTELEFRSFIRRFDREAETSGGQAEYVAKPPTGDQGLTLVESYDPQAVDYRIIRTEEDLMEVCRHVAWQTRVALDTETTSIDPMHAELVGISLSWVSHQGVYIPTPLPDGMSTDAVIAVLGPVLPDLIIGQNLKYDYVVLARHGLRLAGRMFDTMVAHYLVSSSGRHGLDALCLEYLNYRTIPISTLLGSGKEARSMREVPIEQAGPYACEDADVTLRLYAVLHAELERVGLLSLATRMEFPLIAVLADMEMAGICVRTSELEELSAYLTAELQDLEASIHAQAGGPFSIGSGKQLAGILYDRLGLPVLSRTRTGRRSTRESVLQELAHRHRLPVDILAWRHMAKLKNTYVDVLSGLTLEETGRVHTRFNQTVASTGRLSSSSPNLQNIPSRTPTGSRIRKAFVPQTGWMLLSADYSQIELRILASMSGDRALINDFASGKDIHTSTAARIFHIRPEEVVREQRQRAKEVNYGIPYGVSPWGLARRLGISRQEGLRLIQEYHAAYPGVLGWLNETKEAARGRGYVETLLGRRRYVPLVNSRNGAERAQAERVAVNMPIQGTQADMIKIAMVCIHRRLKEEGYQATLLLQVHDELVFELPPGEEHALSELVETEMTEALELAVMPRVTIRTGANWLEVH